MKYKVWLRYGTRGQDTRDIFREVEALTEDHALSLVKSMAKDYSRTFDSSVSKENGEAVKLKELKEACEAASVELAAVNEAVYEASCAWAAWNDAARDAASAWEAAHTAYSSELRNIRHDLIFNVGVDAHKAWKEGKK